MRVQSWAESMQDSVRSPRSIESANKLTLWGAKWPKSGFRIAEVGAPLAVPSPTSHSQHVRLGGMLRAPPAEFWVSPKTERGLSTPLGICAAVWPPSRYKVLFPVEGKAHVPCSRRKTPALLPVPSAPQPVWLRSDVLRGDVLHGGWLSAGMWPPESRHVHLAAPATPKLHVHGEPQQNPGACCFSFFCPGVFSATTWFASAILGEQNKNLLWQNVCWKMSRSYWSQQKYEHWPQQNEHLNKFEPRASSSDLTLRLMQFFGSSHVYLCTVSFSSWAGVVERDTCHAGPSLHLDTWDQRGNTLIMF